MHMLDMLQSVITSQVVFLLVLNVFLVIVGMVMEIFAAIIGKQCTDGCGALTAMRAMRAPGSRKTRGARSHAQAPPAVDRSPRQAH
jgi:hypothetical protein